MRLTDPQNRLVDESYPGAIWFTDAHPLYLIVQNPLPGTWQAQVYGAEVPEGSTPYTLLASTRAAVQLPGSPLRGAIFHDVSGDHAHQAEEPGLLGAPIWLQEFSGPLQIGDTVLQLPASSGDGPANAWVVAAYPVQPGTGERLLAPAREQLTQEFTQFMQAGLPEAAADALLRLYHLDPLNTDLSRWAADLPELGQALARRFGELWTWGAIWDKPIIQGDGPLTSLAFPTALRWAKQPAEALVAAGDIEGNVQVWRLSDGNQVHTLRGLTGPIYGLAFSPDGTIVAAGGQDGMVILWRAEDGSPAARVALEPPSPVRDVAFSPDGQLLAIAAEDGTVHLWELSTSRLARRLQDHRGPVRSLAFSPDGALLATGDEGGVVHIWEVNSGVELRRLEGHGDAVLAVSFPEQPAWERGASGQILATAGRDGLIQLWWVSDGRRLYTLRGHTAPVRSLAFSPDGNWLISGSDDGEMRLWQVSTGALRRLLPASASRVLNLVFSPDGSRLLIGTATGIVQQGVMVGNTAQVVNLPSLVRRLPTPKFPAEPFCVRLTADDLPDFSEIPAAEMGQIVGLPKDCSYGFVSPIRLVPLEMEAILGFSLLDAAAAQDIEMDAESLGAEPEGFRNFLGSSLAVMLGLEAMGFAPGSLDIVIEKVEPLSGLEGIGDASAGIGIVFTVGSLLSMHGDIVLLVRGPVVTGLVTFYPEGTKPVQPPLDLARRLDQQIAERLSALAEQEPEALRGLILVALYQGFEQGQISECVSRDQWIYKGEVSAYDAPSVLFDEMGSLIGGCNYAWGSVDPICEEIEQCEVIYRGPDSMYGPPLDKYGLEEHSTAIYR